MRNSTVTLLAAAAGQAAVLVYIGVLRTVRNSQWSGINAQEFAGILVAGLIYFALLSALGAGVFFLLRGRRGNAGPVAVPLAAALAGAAVWALLTTHQPEDVSWRDFMSLCLLVLLPATGRLIGQWAGLVVFAPAALFTVGAGGYAVLLPNRAEAIALSTSVFVGVTLLACIAMAWLPKTRWVFVPVLAILTVLPFLIHPSRLAYGKDAGPNLVFIVADTLRAKDLRLYGGEIPAPNLEALAARGVLFERAYSLAPWTLPSMTGFFSSRLPDGIAPGDGAAIREQLWKYRMPEDLPPLQQRLRERGYQTGAITGNPVMWGIPGMFDDYKVSVGLHPILLKRGGIFRAAPQLQHLVATYLPALAPLQPADTSRGLSHLATQFMRQADGSFYLWLHYIDPHTPYSPPERYRSLSGDWPFFYPYPGGEAWGIPQLGNADMKFPEERRDLVRDMYRGEIRYVDECLGNVLANLKRQGLEENTYVCFTSDHGEELWEHGEWGHGHALYDESVRVPWIIAGPGVKKGKVESAVSHLDLLPTLADLLGLKTDSAWQGRSMAEALRAGSQPELAPVFIRATNDRAPDDPLESVVDWPYKLIRGAVSGKAKLYDLSKDPGEVTDVAGEHAERVRTMGLLLDGLPRGEAADIEQGGEVMEQLESMGYL